MAKKHSGLSKAAILAAGVGAAAFAAKKHTDHLAEEGQTLSGEIKEAVPDWFCRSRTKIY